MNKYFISLTALIAIGVANATTDTLISDVKLPLVMDGKTVGSMTLKAGTKVTIEQVLPNNEGVMVSKPGQAPFKVATSALSPESLMAATPIPTPTPTKVAETPTNAPAMATPAPAASTPSLPPPTKGSMEITRLVQGAYNNMTAFLAAHPDTTGGSSICQAQKSLNNFANEIQITIRPNDSPTSENTNANATLQEALNKLERVSLAYPKTEHKALQAAVKTIKNTINSYQTSINIEINNTPIAIKRIGKGPIGVIFFNNSGPMDNDIVNHIKAYKNILNNHTFFIWSYPDTTPFNQVQSAINGWCSGNRSIKIDLSGIATLVINEIEKQSQLKQFLIVGDSLGSGIILWDYQSLKLRPELKFLLISPTQVFSPHNLGNIADNTTLISNPGDSYVTDPTMTDWAKKNSTPQTITEKQGHLILGEFRPAGENLPHSQLCELIQLAEKQK